MTLEKLAKSYEVENFFDYIIESQINGNLSQVRELFNEMSKKDRYAFIAYAQSMGQYGRETVQNILNH